MRAAQIPLYVAKIVDYDPRDLFRLGVVIRSTTTVPFVGSPEQVERLLVSINCLDGAPWAEPGIASSVLTTRRPVSSGVYRVETDEPMLVANALGSAQLRDLTLDEWNRIRDELLDACDEIEQVAPDFAAHERGIVNDLDRLTVAEFVDDLDTMIDEVADFPAWRLYLLRVDVAFSPPIDEALAEWRAAEWFSVW